MVIGIIVKAILLGILEGITEFLPVSSTGHLILANKLLFFEGEFAYVFDIVVQSGAVFAVILYFWNKVYPPFHDIKLLKNYVLLWLKVLVAMAPAAILVVGFHFDEFIEHYLFAPIPVALALIVGAILIIIAEKSKHHVVVHTEDDITFVKAFLVGVAQCMAFFPGMSRSASTIIGSLFLGFSRSVAAEFSFFLAIPTLLGASAFKIFRLGITFTHLELQALIMGTFVSFIVAYVVVAAFMSYIKKHDFIIFANYRIALGVVVSLIEFLSIMNIV